MPFFSIQKLWPERPRAALGWSSFNKNFSTLVTAVKEAGLVEALSGEGEFTVFAPTNAGGRNLTQSEE